MEYLSTSYNSSGQRSAVSGQRSAVSGQHRSPLLIHLIFFIAALLFFAGALQVFAASLDQEDVAKKYGISLKRPYDTSKMLIGEYLSDQPASKAKLEAYLRSLLVKMYPEDADQIKKAELVVFNTEDFRAEIAPRLVVKKTDKGKFSVGFRFHLAFSKGSLRELTDNENVLAYVLAHEWRHAQQVLEQRRGLKAEDSQYYELDADRQAVFRLARAGIDPRPVERYAHTDAGQKFFTYESGFIMGVKASHPNYETRVSSLMAAVGEAVEKRQNVPAKIRDIPIDIKALVQLGDSNKTLGLGLAQDPKSRAQGEYESVKSKLVEVERRLAGATQAHLDSPLQNLDHLKSDLILRDQLVDQRFRLERVLGVASETSYSFKLYVLSILALRMKLSGKWSEIDQGNFLKAFDELKDDKGKEKFEEISKLTSEQIFDKKAKWLAAVENISSGKPLDSRSISEISQLNRDIVAGLSVLNGSWLSWKGSEGVNSANEILSAVAWNSLSGKEHEQLQNYLSGLKLRAERASPGQSSTETQLLHELDIATAFRLNGLLQRGQPGDPVHRIWQEAALQQPGRKELLSFFDKDLQRDLGKRDFGDSAASAEKIPSNIDWVRDISNLYQKWRMSTKEVREQLGLRERIAAAISAQMNYWKQIPPTISDFETVLASKAFQDRSFTAEFLGTGENAEDFQRQYWQLRFPTNGTQSHATAPEKFEAWKKLARIATTKWADERLEEEILPHYLTQNDQVRLELAFALFKPPITRSTVAQEKLLREYFETAYIADLRREDFFQRLKTSKPTKKSIRPEIGQLINWINKVIPPKDEPMTVDEMWDADRTIRRQSNSLQRGQLIEVLGSIVPMSTEELVELERQKYSNDELNPEIRLRSDDADYIENWKEDIESDLKYNIIPDEYRNLGSIEEVRRAVAQEIKEYKQMREVVYKRANKRVQYTLQIGAWKKLPPTYQKAKSIVNDKEVWELADDLGDESYTSSWEEDRSVIARRKKMGEAKLISPFYAYNLVRSEEVQKILWPILSKKTDTFDEKFDTWISLARRGATEFTDNLFVKEIYPGLIDGSPKNLERIELILDRQLVYDFDFRKQIWDQFYSHSKLKESLENSAPGKRDQPLAELISRMKQYFPEATPIRANIIEDISNSIRTNFSESRILEEAKRTLNVEVNEGLGVRFFNGMVDAIKGASVGDKILFFKYLRGDALDAEATIRRLKNYEVQIDDDSTARARKRLKAGEEAVYFSVGGYIERFGFERIRRFWAQLSGDVQAGLVNPLLIGKHGMLEKEEGRERFVEEVVPKGGVVDREEAKAALVDYIKALHITGRAYMDSFVQAYIFFRNREGGEKSLGTFLKELFEANGTIGIALGQRLANLEVFDKKTSETVGDLRDRASPPVRYEVYDSLKKIYKDAEKDVLLGKQLLGSASVKVVADVERHDSESKPVEEAIAIYREEAKRRLELDAETLRQFLKLRVQANPERYGFLVPVLENVIIKKRTESDPKEEATASKIAHQIYEGRKDRTTWEIRTVDAEHLAPEDFIRMNKINAVRFKDLSVDEKREVSLEILKVHSLEALGESNELKDDVIIDPDIHSGNFLVDPKAKIIYAFDKAQLIAVPRRDLDSFYGLLAWTTVIRMATGPKITPEMEKSIDNLTEALETLTGSKIQNGFKRKVAEYFVKNPEAKLSGTTIIQDILNIQRLAGNSGLHLSNGFQDWLNMVQNLVWYERNSQSTAHFSDRLQQKVQSQVMNIMFGKKPPMSLQQDCGGLLRLMGLLNAKHGLK